MAFQHLIDAVVGASVSKQWRTARGEWEVISCEDLGACEGVCICGHESIRYAFTIRNVFNGITLEPIGLKCIHQFEQDEMNAECDNLKREHKLAMRVANDSRMLSFRNSEDKRLFSRRYLRNLKVRGVLNMEQYEFMLAMFNGRTMTPRQYAKHYGIMRTRIYPHLVDIANQSLKRKDTEMPKLKKSWKDIEETSGGAFSDIEPGAYILTITKVEPHDKQEYARVFWDVAEGPSKGNYAQSQYPPSDVLSWKETAQGMLKHKLHRLADWNQGFQPTVAFDNDQWGQFVGKRFGAVVRRRLYTAGPNSKNPGADRTAIEIAAWLKPDEYEGRTWSETLLKDRDQRDKGAAPQQQAAPTPPSMNAAADLYDEDVPF